MKSPVYLPAVRPARAQDQGPFNDAFQLPDVPGPRVILQRLHRFFLDRRDLFSQFLGISLHEFLNHQRDVFFPLPEWRDGDGEHVQTIVKVLPKPALADLFFKVSICRRHDPHIDFDGMDEPRRSNSLCWTARSSLALHLQRQFPDLVQAKGGTVGEPRTGPPAGYRPR